MKIKLIYFLILIPFLSCNKHLKTIPVNTEQKMDSVSVNTELSSKKTELAVANWYDDLIVNYIKNSENELIKLSLAHNQRIEWLLDRKEKTDSTNYYIFTIGQEVSEEDGSNKRFSTNGWIYIDSISKTIYEYDLPNDTLIAWKNRP